MPFSGKLTAWQTTGANTHSGAIHVAYVNPGNAGATLNTLPNQSTNKFATSFLDNIKARDERIAKAKADHIAAVNKMVAEKQRAARLKAAQATSVAKSSGNTVSNVAPVYNNSYSGSLGDWLYKLRMCESDGDYTINTGNGYYGAYQFTIATWNNWHTGYARADLAPPAVQDATIIKNTLGTSGLSTQNPGCMASQGLSNYPPQ